jgi:hypothetical protein
MNLPQGPQRTGRITNQERKKTICQGFEMPNGPRYRRLEGRGLAQETDKIQSHEKANLAVRIQPSACTPCWAAFLTGPTTPWSTNSSMKTYFPWRIKVIAKTSANEEIIAGTAKLQALGT